MKKAYKDFNFRGETLALIDVMNTIVDDYESQGFVLTVRQLYYQLVAKDAIENTERSYKKITSIVNDARLAGLMDWDAIEDRTREFVSRSGWSSPSEIVATCARQYHEDMWKHQDHRVFVIVEKEALAGVLEPVCREYDLPLLAARGYPSVTVLREFTERMILPNRVQQIVILHLGDHDPSGIDMSRDLLERIELFAEGGASIEFKRIALNMKQIEEENPPPNPAKVTDSRFADYERIHGSSSWELDALPPTYIANLVKKEVKQFIDLPRWEAAEDSIKNGKDKIKDAVAYMEKQ